MITKTFFSFLASYYFIVVHHCTLISLLQQQYSFVHKYKKVAIENKFVWNVAYESRQRLWNRDLHRFFRLRLIPISRIMSVSVKKLTKFFTDNLFHYLGIRKKWIGSAPLGSGLVSWRSFASHQCHPLGNSVILLGKWRIFNCSSICNSSTERRQSLKWGEVVTT